MVEPALDRVGVPRSHAARVPQGHAPRTTTLSRSTPSCHRPVRRAARQRLRDTPVAASFRPMPQGSCSESLDQRPPLAHSALASGTPPTRAFIAPAPWRARLAAPPASRSLLAPRFASRVCPIPRRRCSTLGALRRVCPGSAWPMWRDAHKAASLGLAASSRINRLADRRVGGDIPAPLTRTPRLRPFPKRLGMPRSSTFLVASPELGDQNAASSSAARRRSTSSAPNDRRSEARSQLIKLLAARLVREALAEQALTAPLKERSSPAPEQPACASRR